MSGDVWGKPSPLEDAYRAMNGDGRDGAGREETRMRNRTAILVAAAGVIPIAAGVALFSLLSPRSTDRLIEEPRRNGPTMDGGSDRSSTDRVPRPGVRGDARRDSAGTLASGSASGAGPASGLASGANSAAVVRRAPEQTNGAATGSTSRDTSTKAPTIDRARTASSATQPAPDAGSTGSASAPPEPRPAPTNDGTRPGSSNGTATGRVETPTDGDSRQDSKATPATTSGTSGAAATGGSSTATGSAGAAPAVAPASVPDATTSTPTSSGAGMLGGGAERAIDGAGSTSVATADRAELIDKVSSLQRELKVTQDRLGALAGEMERRMSQLREQDAVLQRTLVTLQDAERAREGEAARRQSAEVQREKTTAALMSTHELYGPLTPVRIEYRKASQQRQKVAERADVPLGPLWDGIGDIFVGAFEAVVGPQGDGHWVALFPGGGEALVERDVMERWRSLGVEVVEVDPLPATLVVAPAPAVAPAAESVAEPAPAEVPAAEPASPSVQ